MRFATMCRLAAVPICLALLACSSTKAVTSWSDSSYAGPPFEKMLIIGLLEEDLDRRNFEDVFVERLRRDGVQAVPSYSLMANSKDAADRSEIQAAVLSAGADSVLLMSLVALNEEERYVPPAYDWAPAMGYRGGFYGGYMASYDAMYRPGYVTKDVIVTLQTQVYAVANEDLVWAARTESFNPNSRDAVIGELADIVVKALREEKLL